MEVLTVATGDMEFINGDGSTTLYNNGDVAWILTSTAVSRRIEQDSPLEAPRGSSPPTDRKSVV